MIKKNLAFIFCSVVLLIVPSCDKNDDFVIFSIEDDIALGEQVAQEIESNPQEYPVLDPKDYPEAYAYVNAIKDRILSSDDITYRDEFEWRLRLIDQDVLNAFAAPGGYIYVYTGLIKFLENEDDLAGVLGHEFAHADRRHTSKRIQKQYGIQVLLSVLLGNDPGILEEIAAGLAGNLTLLAFSRSDESEADAYSVRYLADTDYQCNGAASFFQLLLDNDQAAGVPEFLSTHPSPESRVEDINNEAGAMGCSVTPYAPVTYQDFKDMLP